MHTNKFKQVGLLLLFMLSFRAADAYDFKVGGLCYNINDDNVSVTVTYDVPQYRLSGNVEIPAQVSNEGVIYDVTAIGESAFANCSDLTNITIPNSVITIGRYAFMECKGLTDIKFGDSVTTIGKAAFSWCSALTRIDMPASIKTIGSSAFSRCTGLTGVYITDLEAWCGISFDIDRSANPLYYAHNLFVNDGLVQDLVIPESITALSPVAFAGCTSLTSVTLPKTVTTIGEGAFMSCENLKTINIPDSVTSISLMSFNRCSSLESIILPDAVKIICGNSFQQCLALKEIVIPDSVTTVVGYAFNGCSDLTSVTIGKSVTLVDQDVFTGCDKLSTIYCKAQTPPKLGYSRLYPFQGLVYSPAFDTTHYQNSTLYVPKGCADIYSSADNWSNFRNIVEMDFVPDIDGDGKADIADINAAVNVMLGLESNDTYGGRADIDGDNKVDVADLNAIMNAVLDGKRDKNSKHTEVVMIP